VFAGKKSAQIREILISESAWEEMTCLTAPSLAYIHHNNDYLFEASFSMKDLNFSPRRGLPSGFRN
jgi:hypothetical protein